MKKIFILLVVLLISAGGYAQQQKNRADRFYAKNDYSAAIKYYEAGLEKERTKEAIERLADSYYNLSDYRNAALYYKQLANGRFVEADKTYDNSVNHRIFQVLNATGNSEEALAYLEVYYQNKGTAFAKADAQEELKRLATKAPNFTVSASNVSSEASDFGAIKVGDSIFFVSDRPSDNAFKAIFGKRYNWTGRQFLDIYAVKVTDKNTVNGLVVPVNGAINTNLHDGNFTLNQEGTEMILSRSSYEDGSRSFDDENTNNIHLYKSVRIDGIWRPAEKLSFVNEAYNYEHPALSPDGKRLYFSSDMPGGEGGFDLYYVSIKMDGSFSEPKNLGALINTPQREQFPFIGADGDLYFASNGHLGLGMMDLFVSPLTVKGFTQPVNLGAPINSPYDDFSLSYYNETDGLFSSNRNKFSDNIFSFVQTDEIIQRDFNTIFEVRDEETKALITNANIQVLGYQGKVLFDAQPNGTGIFEIPLPVDDYTVVANSEDHKKNTVALEVRGIDNKSYEVLLTRVISEDLQDIIAEKNIDKSLVETDKKRFDLLVDQQNPPVIERDGKLFFEVPPIYFEFDESVISKESEVLLDDLYGKLKRFETITIVINSHTDTRGPALYNQPLSERRAKATYDYLVNKKGVDPSRLEWKAFGESQPIIDCPAGECTEAQHQMNRRSEFEITGY